MYKKIYFVVMVDELVYDHCFLSSHYFCLQKEIAAHKNATKGGAFKLNMHPRAYFDANPYASDRPGKRGGSAGLPSKKDDSKPFKPSSPGKRVTMLFYNIKVF